MASIVQEGAILLGKYRVEKELGRGAMGYVVAARHEHLGELFAVKLMLPEAVEKPDAAARFLREARACARLKSDHVVRVTDSGETEDGVPVMVMEYLIGEDLQSILDKRQMFSMHEALTYVLEACDAIAEAHEMGIIHRDLKPSNLFATQRPNGKTLIKVLDFGISKDLNSADTGGLKLTATGSIVGTPYYMSPEQMLAKATDNRSELWSLGVILYEFVTGQLPFPGQNYAEIAGKVIYEEPVSPREFRPALPQELDGIIMRCLEKDPDKRFASVRDFMAALKPLLSLPDVNGISIISSRNGATQVDGDKDTVPHRFEASAGTANDRTSSNAWNESDSGAAPKPREAAPNAATAPPSPAIESKPGPASATDGSDEAPIFYAKRVFGHQTKKRGLPTVARDVAAS